ncbi:MAG: sterol desaturase family protein [Planctomycetaceae bacterium]|nr:sterol desaturase family protein [Planctomycetaceae bacterium]
MNGQTFQLWPDLPLWILRLLFDNLLRYIMFAGIAWILLYDVFLNRLIHRKVIPGLPARAAVMSEVQNSAVTIVVYAVVGVQTVWLVSAEYTQFYLDIHQYSWLWFWTSIVVAILIHDTWFYWTHRLLHAFRILRAVHRVHHESTNPTPWTSYSFSPLEAFIQALIFPLLLITIPMHLFAFLFFLIWMMTWNVVNHAGFEYTRPWMTRGFPGRLWMTPTGHVMHHENGHWNFGLYFLFWDRLMGTLSPDYDTRLLSVQHRTKAP